MTKKSFFALALVALFLASMLIMASCAKKQTKVTEEVATPAPTVTAPPKTEEPQKATSVADEGVAGKTEEQQQARLRDQQAAQRLKAEIEAFESTRIYFDFDKSELRPEARLVLEKKAAWLRANGDYKVRIEGHCDERGTNEYNLALGERRAKEAAKYLNALGISTERTACISYGEERPADPGHDESAWAKNRRDEFKLAK